MAPAPISRQPRHFARLGNPSVQRCKLLRLHHGKHQAHALARLLVDDSRVGRKRFRAFREAHIRHCSQSKWIVRVHVAALLAQIAHPRFQPRAGLLRDHLNSSSKRIARMSPPVSPGFRRGTGSRLFPISGLHDRTSRILAHLRKISRTRKILQFILDLDGTRKPLGFFPKTGGARKCLHLNLNFDGTRHPFGFNADYALVRRLRALPALPLPFATLRTHNILMLPVPPGRFRMNISPCHSVCAQLCHSKFVSSSAAMSGHKIILGHTSYHRPSPSMSMKLSRQLPVLPCSSPDKKASRSCRHESIQPLARATFGRMERHLRHPAHVDANRWQGPPSPLCPNKPLVEYRSLRHRPRPHHISNPLRKRHFLSPLRFHQSYSQNSNHPLL